MVVLCHYCLKVDALDFSLGCWLFFDASFGFVWLLHLWVWRCFYGEFDPGSGRTLAACLTHASRTMKRYLYRGLVANG